MNYEKKSVINIITDPIEKATMYKKASVSF